MRYHDLPGDGPALLFVHGLGCASSSDYPRVAGEPALHGRRRLLVDLLGSGFSDRPEAFDYTVAGHASTLLALVDGLALDAFDLFGHSMGGAVAIELASRIPQRVRRLVLSEPNLDAGGGFFSRPTAEQSEARYVDRGHDEAVREALAHGDPIWAGSLCVSAPHAIHRAALSLVRGGTPSWRDRLGALPMPRTVLIGARSLPEPDTVRLPALGVHVEVIADAGHSMAWEAPAALAAAIGRAIG